MAVAVECASEIIKRSNRCPISWRAVDCAIVVQYVFIDLNIGCQDGVYSVVAAVHFIGEPIEFARVANSVVAHEIGSKIQTVAVAFGYQSAMNCELAANRAVTSNLIYRRVWDNCTFGIAECDCAWLRSIYYKVVFI